MQCHGRTQAGARCRNQSQRGSKYCHMHRLMVRQECDRLIADVRRGAEEEENREAPEDEETEVDEEAKVKEEAEEKDVEEKDAGAKLPEHCFPIRKSDRGKCLLTLSDLRTIYARTASLGAKRTDVNDLRAKAGFEFDDRESAIRKALATPKPCASLAAFFNLKAFQFLSYVHAGAYNIVFRVYNAREKANEILRVGVEDTSALPPSESEKQERAHRLGLAPQVFDSFEFRLPRTEYRPKPQTLQALTMEEYDMSLLQAMQCFPKARVLDLVDKVNQILHKFKEHKITHGDFHLGNILIQLLETEALEKPASRRDRNKVLWTRPARLTVIDWSRASFLVHAPDVDQSAFIRHVRLGVAAGKIDPAWVDDILAHAFEGFKVDPVLLRASTESLNKETSERRKAYRKLHLAAEARQRKPRAV